MVISCSAYACSNKWSRKTSIHFHKFPLKSKTLCDKWVSALKRKDFTPTTASIVCSDHFKWTDYVRRPGIRKRFLKKNAVPSKFKFPLLNKSFIDVSIDAITALSDSIEKEKRENKERKKNTKKKSKLESTEVIELVELSINENDSTTNTCTDSNDYHDSSEEDIELINADEEDKCSILGSIWAERLNLIPLSLRPVVRRLIDQIFEDARTGKLTESNFLAEGSRSLEHYIQYS